MVLSGVIPPPIYIHGSELLDEVARIMKPSGTLTLSEPITLLGKGGRGKLINY